MKKKCILLLAMFFVFLRGTLTYANTEGVNTGLGMITEPAFTYKGHAIQDKKEAAINDAATKAQVQESYGKLPLCFIQNDGQMDKAVLFYEKQSAHSTFFTRNGIYLTLVNGQISEKPEAVNSKMPHRKSEIQNPKSAVIKLVPLGANKDPEVIAEGLQEGKINYLVGSPERWKTNIPTYQAVVYKDIYKNIDMKFYGNNRQLEYDIIVKPGANPSRVRLAYRGIKGWKITEDGDLSIDLENGKVVQKKPYVYQVINGKKVEVEGRFKIQDARGMKLEGWGANRQGRLGECLNSENKNRKSKIQNPKFIYGFQVASYDKRYPLFIDPTSLVYSTYFGGNANDDNYSASKSIAIDSSGNVYLTGETISTNLATSTGAYRGRLNNGSNTVNYDAFVTKLNSSLSSIQYCTYLGGSGTESAYGIAVDSSGSAYVAGYTTSSDFGTASAYQGNLMGSQDGFVTKLNTAGTGVVYSTYLGGSSDDYCDDIAIDSSGNAYIVGATWSNDFGTYSAAYANLRGNVDAFVTKLNSSGGSSTAYSTFIGGNGTDTGWAIAVDSSGNAYISGNTSSADLGTSTSAFQGNKAASDDCFLVKLNSNGGTDTGYCTYLGGSGDDEARGLAVDTSGNAYLTGYTVSNNFPTTSGAYQTSYGGGNRDGFVTKLNSAGSGLSYSTYLGGSGTDTTNCIAVDGSGYAYVVGDTSSSNFPTTDAIYGSLQGGTYDTFASKLNTSGSGFIYSTYLGGNSDEYVWGIALDSSNNPYIAGYTASSNFPTTSGAYQTSYNTGTWDIFVSKISYSSPTTEEPIPKTTLSISSTNPSSGATGVAVNIKVEATFSMLMNGSTLNTGTFKLSGGGSNVSGNVTTDGAKAIFTPSSNLSYNTSYTATITTGAQAANYAGTTLESAYSWSFTTENAPAVTPSPTPTPSVTATATPATVSSPTPITTVTATLVPTPIPTPSPTVTTAPTLPPPPTRPPAPTPTVVILPTPEATATTTPLPTECIPESMTVSSHSLSLKRKDSKEVTVTVIGSDGCLVEGDAVAAKIGENGKKYISILRKNVTTDANGEARFKIKAKKTKGNASVTFVCEEMEETIAVKVAK
ncbi:MAG: SBBP repeat-containing protein [Planctomycetes bacterium]|nr:SBBP repeat-containing protein [Planctomycetota bacterium]